MIYPLQTSTCATTIIQHEMVMSMGGYLYTILHEIQIIDMQVGVSQISIECDAYNKSYGLRINDILLVLDCVFGILIEGDRVNLCIGVGDLPLSQTIQSKRWECFLCGLRVVVYGGRCSLMGSIVFHQMGVNILCGLSWLWLVNPWPE